MKHSSPPAVRWQSCSQITRQTLRSSLRSDTSNKVRLAMSLTSCWILGEYCLGAPSSGGVAMASEWVAGLVFSCLRAQRAGVCRWSCCLENKEKDKPSIRTLKHQVCKSFVKYGGWRTQYYREGKTQFHREDEDSQRQEYWHDWGRIDVTDFIKIKNKISKAQVSFVTSHIYFSRWVF